MIFGTVLAQADTNFDLSPGGDYALLTEVTVEGIVAWAVTAVLVVAAIIFFFMLIIGGIKWITSGGDKGQTEAARGQITAALIGLVIVFAAWAIITLIANIFGVNILNLTLPSIVGSGGAPAGGSPGGAPPCLPGQPC